MELNPRMEQFKDPASDSTQVRSVRQQAINFEYQTLVAAIRRHEDVLNVLRFHQPLSSKDLLGYLGISKTSLQQQLRALINRHLVVQTRFEAHTLYCIDGKYNAQVFSTLLDLQERRS